ncbi:MAG: class II fumarate hydratase [Desulfobulbaceae bacterium]|nr:MAG: class II fumarate hydratase [Desulfobulbaceae bacterium]
MEHKIRIERDSMGEVELPETALYGPQTQRALNNFTISNQKMDIRFINSLLQIKRAAAEANQQLGLLPLKKAKAIFTAIDELGDNEMMRHFPVPMLQTGSGTSTNMNANEVVARLAALKGIELSPNDDVNMGQSSNDVIPSALHISSAIQIKTEVIPALTELIEVIEKVAVTHRQVVKTGRTHLMDALPIRFSDELKAWSSQFSDNIERLTSVLGRLKKVPLGGTAVGSGVNCAPGFIERALKSLNKRLSSDFGQMDSAYKGLSSIDTVLETSGHLKTCAVTLMKIANDLRWMNSGPHSGLAEIRLKALQPGSSIMVDKVNPVIPEAVCMAAARVIGNDLAITVAAQSGNFQLNTMLPLAANDLLSSGELIANGCLALGEKGIGPMEILAAHMAEPLAKTPVLVTSLTPHIGYMKAAAIAKKAREENRPILEVALEEADLDPDLLNRLLDPRYLADGGRD